jgi:hypothetical protein
MTLNRGFENQADWVSLEPGTGNSAAIGLDYLHNGHQLAFWKAEHMLPTMVWFPMISES